MRQRELSGVIDGLADVAINACASPARKAKSENSQRFIINSVGSDAVALATGVGDRDWLRGTREWCEEGCVNSKSTYIMGAYVADLHRPRFTKLMLNCEIPLLVVRRVRVRWHS